MFDLESEKVHEWKNNHPRLWWGFKHLKKTDELRDSVLTTILEPGEDGLKSEAFRKLEVFTEALEVFSKVNSEKAFQPPSAYGERRSFPVFFLDSFRTLEKERARPLFYVGFISPKGWGGFTLTSNPQVIEVASSPRKRKKAQTLVGEVSRRSYRFFVELNGNVKIV